MENKIIRADGSVLTGIKTVTYTEQVNAGTDLCPGCVSSAYIDVAVYGDQDGAVTSGEVLTYYQVASDGNETLFGTFYPEPTIQTRNTYSFTAYDAVSKLDVGFSEHLLAIQDRFPMSLSALVGEACSVAGVTLSGTFPMSDMEVQAFYSDGITCRQVLSWAAEIACRFVRCNVDGTIKFDWYSAVNEYHIAPSDGGTEIETLICYKQDGLHYENYETSALDRVAVHPTDEEQIAYIYPTSVTSGNTLDITNNILMTGADEAVYKSVAQNIYETLSSLGTYRPSQISLFPFNNPFRAGDIVKVTDIQGVSFATPIMSMIVKESAAQLESTGNKKHAGSSSTLQGTLVSLADNIVRLRKLKVDWADIQQAVINTLQATGIDADWINAGTVKFKFLEGLLIKSRDYTTTKAPWVFPAETIYPLTTLYPSRGETVVSGFAIDLNTGEIFGGAYSEDIAALEARIYALENALTYPKAPAATLAAAPAAAGALTYPMDITDINEEES